MKCFSHHDRDSVGICKSCARGLCAECAVEVDKGLACRGRCEDDVRLLVAYIQGSVQRSRLTLEMLDSAPRRSILAGVFLFAFGLIYLIADFTYQTSLSWFSLVGLLFLGAGLTAFVQGFRLSRKPR